MSDARKILLIKHAESLLTPEVTAERWRLTDAGRAACGPLAERLRPFGLARLVSSTELKAMETAQLVAHALGIASETGIGLHEHDRSNVRLVPREEFERRIALFLAHPHELVYGRETADEAYARFRAAVERTIAEHAAERIGIVTHGTVMSLLLARTSGRDALELWRSLPMPAVAVVGWPLLRLEELITDIGQ